MVEWMAYAELEPFGPMAENLNAGIVASTIVSVNRKKGSKVTRPYEMALGDFTSGEKQPMEDMLNTMKSVAKRKEK